DGLQQMFASEKNRAFGTLPVNSNGVDLLLDKEWRAAYRGTWPNLLSFVEDQFSRRNPKGCPWEVDKRRNLRRFSRNLTAEPLSRPDEEDAQLEPERGKAVALEAVEHKSYFAG